MVSIKPAEPTARTLDDITRREVSLYAATCDTATFYPVLDDEHHTYSVIVVENDRSMDNPIWVFVMARVMGDEIIIDADTDDKPLLDALMVNGGIPREQIVLAYQGAH